MLKRTPLYEAHKALGARLIDFGGWEMPVQYTSIIEEHKAVREAAGLFDISHMGEFSVSGNCAEEFLNRTLTNDVRSLQVGQGHYTQICDSEGGTIDDLYVYRLGEDVFELVVNASRIEADAAWMRRQLRAFDSGEGGEVAFLDESESWSAVALQGPQAEIVMRTMSEEVCALQKNEIGRVVLERIDQAVWISRTGYTGEDGFEIICGNDAVVAIWIRLIEAGAKPCGLGARDTLRTEVCYPLYGHELTDKTTPLEAGIGWSVAWNKGDFVGREVLARMKEEGVKRRLIAFKMTGKSAPPRPGYPIWSAGEDAKMIGEVTSGTQSPSLGIGIGLGYVPREFARKDTPIEIEIRGRRSPAIVAAKPLYRKESTD